ncbi:uncharacterized protein HMPREF1541_05834 [Cyphellophora europaea CBS 101466]|uniref:SET domain-containing protein n=1 Tax=Cyphellophora europaea (strain CBS 101466) TaxID=1220924 RepID=W2RV14_CYPE1|nr:uncharacterized protein HMPREF1541_05834 [Cyphellophora europaea CBS 101466]ETN39608.1 hypothetical protein HMPREF1541_05834 [Cyphellophora europaea CBS 101466]
MDMLAEAAAIADRVDGPCTYQTSSGSSDPGPTAADLGHTNVSQDAVAGCADPTDVPATTEHVPGGIFPENYEEYVKIRPSSSRPTLLDRFSCKYDMGLFAEKSFDEVGELIVSLPAGICDIFPAGLHDFRGPEIYTMGKIPAQHLTSMMHLLAATYRTYERLAPATHQDRPFDPCFTPGYAMALLKGKPTEEVQLAVDKLNQMHLATEGDPSATDGRVDHAGSHNDLFPCGPDRLEDAMRALRFLDGAFVAEDVTDAHIGYSHLTSYINHSCTPNALLVTDFGEQHLDDGLFARTMTVHLKALARIRKGEEITISYNSNAPGPRDKRRFTLNATTGFDCQCISCRMRTNENQWKAAHTCVMAIAQGKRAKGNRYQSSSSAIFDALQGLGLNGYQTRYWCTQLAQAAKTNDPPDRVREWIFRSRELAWCKQFLHESHGRRINLEEIIDDLGQHQDVSEFLQLGKEFIGSKDVDRTIFLLDVKAAETDDQLLGKDLIPELKELQAKQRRKKKSDKEKTRKKGKAARKNEEAQHEAPTTQEEAKQDDGRRSDGDTLPAESPKTSLAVALKPLQHANDSESASHSVQYDRRSDHEIEEASQPTEPANSSSLVDRTKGPPSDPGALPAPPSQTAAEVPGVEDFQESAKPPSECESTSAVSAATSHSPSPACGDDPDDLSQEPCPELLHSRSSSDMGDTPPKPVSPTIAVPEAPKLESQHS